MKLLSIGLFFISRLLALPDQVLDDGKRIAFGQNLKELEKIYSRKAADQPSPGRRGIDTELRLGSITLEFDTSRLNKIEFKSPYQYKRSEERRVGKECRSRWSPY